ncbi:MAG: hypothetical protein HY074_00865 [Deltaproteobacteria bacterium]|nr:hypothetical protein [Deltaproteobacteria bacterium]
MACLVVFWRACRIQRRCFALKTIADKIVVYQSRFVAPHLIAGGCGRQAAAELTLPCSIVIAAQYFKTTLKTPFAAGLRRCGRPKAQHDDKKCKKSSYGHHHSIKQDRSQKIRS